MNLKEGGQGGFVNLKAVKKGRRITDEILEKKYGKDFRKIISKNYQNSLSENDRKENSEKIKKRLKEIGFNHSTFKGKKHKEESKNNIGKKNSIKQKGNKNSQYGTCWITNGSDNKKIYKGDLIPKGWRLGRVIKKK
jgi:hypothetical protein